MRLHEDFVGTTVVWTIMLYCLWPGFRSIQGTRARQGSSGSRAVMWPLAPGPGIVGGDTSKTHTHCDLVSEGPRSQEFFFS